MINYKQALFALAGLTIIGSAFFFTRNSANASPKEGEVFGSWVVRCAKDDAKNKSTCFLVQQLEHKDKEDESKSQVIAAYQVGYLGEDKKLRIIEILPLGVSLVPGTSIISGGKLIVPAKYNICTSVGCHAAAELSNEDLETLTSNKENSVAFMNGEGKQVSLPIQSDGLKEGLEALKK